MVRVFVSHSSKDAALAAQVHRWLVDGGHEAFLDQDLADGILAGEAWERRLHERLRWADAVVCLLTSAYLASVWCTAELAIAQSRGSRLLPVQAEPGVRHPLLNSVQYVDMTVDAAAARARVAEALLRVDAAGGYGWSDDRSPFPGLRPLDTAEHSVFFGRSQEIQHLATLLRAPAERADPAVLLVVGPSGCGKSSLVRAGLLPVMAAEEDWWTLPAILPGRQPIAALASALAQAAHRVGLAWTVTEVDHRLHDGGLTLLVHDLLLAVPGRRRRLLLVVDQFEELLAQTAPEERARFAELLRDALAGPVQVLATLRPEFLDPLLASPELAALPTRTQTLRPLRPEALRAVIEGPADRAGIGVDAELVTRLVADTGGGEALPLLAYTLEKLADGVTRGGRLSATRYEELGGVRGALARQADAALAAAVTAGGRDRDLVIRELLRLVTVDEQNRPTRWRIRRDDLPDQVRTELQPFIDGHLLTTDTEHDHDTGQEYVVLGVAHEAFLSAWPPLSEAITASAAALRARHEIERAAEQWAEEGHTLARLWERGQLATALTDTGAHLQLLRGQSMKTSTGVGPPRVGPWPHWFRRHRTLVVDRVQLSAQARNFLRASMRRDRRRRSRAVTVLSTLLVVTLSLGTATAFALNQRVQAQSEAERGQRLATARLLITEAESIVNSDPRAALQMLEAAQHIHPDAETRSALVRNVLRTSYVATLPDQSLMAFISDGHTLATMATAGGVEFWNLTDPTHPIPQGSMPDPTHAPISSEALTSDGHTLATAELGAQDASVVKLWDLTDSAQPTLRGSLPGQVSQVTTMAFTPDGHTLATAELSVADTMVPPVVVKLWNLTDSAQPTLRGSLPGQVSQGSTMAFAPDGHTLAIAGDGVELWDLTDPAHPTLRGSLPGQNGPTSGVAFAPDGHTLAIAGDGVELWDLTDPAHPTLRDPLPGQNGPTSGVAFAPDGHTLATNDFGGVLLWDLTDPAHPTLRDTSLPDQDSGVSDVALASDGQTVASVGGDGGVLLWDLTDAAQPTLRGSLPGQDSGPFGLTLTRDGHTLATTDSKGVELWDLTNPTQPTRELLVDPDSIFSSAMAFAPDGHTLATNDFDGVLLLHLTDPAHPTHFASLPSRSNVAFAAMAFGPDGHTLATASDSVLLWDLTDPAHPTLRGSLPGQNSEVSAMAFAPDGHTLATNDFGGVLLWDLTDPAHPTHFASLPSQNGSTYGGMAFSSDGRTLVTATTSTISRWDLTGLIGLRDHALQRACAITAGGLERTQWARYVPGLEYVDVCKDVTRPR